MIRAVLIDDEYLALDLLDTSREDFVMEREFTPSDQATRCVIKFGINNIYAKAFGRGTEEKSID